MAKETTPSFILTLEMKTDLLPKKRTKQGKEDNLSFGLFSITKKHPFYVLKNVKRYHKILV